jgi:membrane-bound lytic murein transglycosylase MltF
MIKKRLITTLGMLGLLLIAKLFIFSKIADSDTLQNFAATSSQNEFSKELYLQNLNFAQEDFPIDDERIIKKMKASLQAHSFKKLQTSKLHQLSEKWFPIIEPILLRYGIPSDFKYMPLVESGFKSGKSPKGAEGFWQFMPNTARTYGLTVNSEIDERLHIEKSTIAAAKYLKSLYREFGSWTLAAAAYNIGEGGLRKQMNHQKEDDYFKIKLNRETASYVYKLISMKEIIENPTRYGYTSRVSTILAQVKKKPENHFPFEGIKAPESPQVLVN